MIKDFQKIISTGGIRKRALSDGTSIGIPEHRAKTYGLKIDYS